MCGDGKQAYREQGNEPRPSQELWANSPMNPENKSRQRIKKYMEVLEESVR